MEKVKPEKGDCTANPELHGQKEGAKKNAMKDRWSPCVALTPPPLWMDAGQEDGIDGA